MVANRSRWWSRVARFFCVSNSQRHILIQAGMPAQRLDVKYNFVVDPFNRRSGPGEYLLYLGRLTDEKGVRLLITAWDLLGTSGGRGLPLVFAGAGPLHGELARWAQDRENVRYLGLQTRAQCAELVARAAAVVAPSAWLEAFGLVVVEAMAAAVPAVAAAHGAFVELVEDGVTGLLHRPGDAGSLAECLRRVVGTPERNLEMGEAARRRYQRNFTPSVGLDRLVAGYQDAIAEVDSCEPL
jgi:glycosyltransferase involved in cell wall biosynthesis